MILTLPGLHTVVLNWQDHAVIAPEVLPRTSPARRILGVIVLLVGAAVVALTVYGAWNPKNYVVLLTHFHNPFAGLFIVIVTFLIAWVVAFPVRSVDDRRRSQVRTTFIVLAVITFLLFAFIYLLRLFRFDSSIMATAADGKRSVALVHLYNTYEVHVYVGTGLTQRDVGTIGVPCGVDNGSLTAKFVNGNEIKISTSYNNYDIHLNPTTAAPLDHFGRTCTG